AGRSGPPPCVAAGSRRRVIQSSRLLGLAGQPGFQQQRRGQAVHRVVSVTGRRTTAAFTQRLFGFEGGKAFINAVHRQLEAPVQAAGELLRPSAHLARGAVHVQRQADDQRIRLPFTQQGGDLLPV